MKHISLVFAMMLVCISMAFAQRTISGTVTDETGAPLPFANVFVENTTIGSTTDIDGNYTLNNVPEDGGVIVVSYVGYPDFKQAVGDSNTIAISMTQGVDIDEVVVVGYNSVKRSDLTSAISTVSGDDLKNIPVASMDNLLQGKSTGALVIAQNGRPGGQAYIRIRGVGSYNASNEPLFFVDNVQVTSSDYNAINPNDIEDLSILKDAAATSIYGARGSNGVVLVTTKRGKKGRPRISYDFQYGIKEKTPDNFDMMNGNQKLDYELALGNRTEEEVADLRSKLSFLETDWQDVLLRQGQFQSHNLGISGGGEKTSYYFSLGTYGEEGIAKVSNFDRLTGRMNAEFQASDWLKIGNTMTIARTVSNELRDRNNVQNPFRAMYEYNPYETEFQLDDDGNELLDENGSPRYNLTHEGFSISEAIENNPETEGRISGIGSLYAEAQIIDGLKLKSTIGGNYRIYRRDYFIKPGSILDGYVGDPDAPGIKTDNGSDRLIYNWTNTASYNTSFSDVHNFGALVGTEYIDLDFKSFSISAKGFASDILGTLDNAAEITDGESTHSQERIWSMFAEGKYNYDSRYYFTLLGRRDASSKLGADNRAGYFWASSAAWNLAEEAFVENSNFLNQLKLRVSVGTSGNVPTARYDALGVYGFTSYNDQTGSIPSRLTNSTLNWETSLNASVGIDFGLFRNRLSGSFDFYNRKTSNLLFDRPISETVGFDTKLENIGDFVNQGVELELRGVPVRTKSGLTWDVFGSFTYNQNEVTNLENDGEDLINAFSGLTLLREGLEVNTFYLVRNAGVDPATGDELYYDTNGNITNEFSPDYLVALEGKTPQPKYFGSFGTSLDFRGINFGVNFYYSGGNYIYNSMEQNMLSDGGNISDNQRADALNYWTTPGQTGVLPRPFAGNPNNNSDRYLQRGDFLRLKNISIGYDLPSGIAQKAKIIQGARIYAQATNLWTYIPYYKGDPEVGIGSGESDLNLPGEISLYSFPQTRGMTFGLNVTF